MDTKNFPVVLHETAMVWRNLMDKRLKPLGLSQAKWRTLLHLSLVGHAMTQRELAARMGIEGPTLVGLLDRLAHDGWIARQEAHDDRRCKTVHLTPKANDTLKSIYSILDEISEELLSPFSAEELEQCVSVLRRIKGRAEAAL